jgi:poly(A) polymerase
MENTIQYNTALSIVKRLVGKGYLAFFAGGYVRDMELGLEQKSDIDIATNATPDTISSIFNHVAGVGEHFGVMLVIEDGIPFEVATFRSDIGTDDGRHPREVVFTTPEMDAQRRDFTINGMFLNPLTSEVIDYVNGLSDLKNGILRAIGDARARFSEDYLRLLRAVRFAARFGFSIEPDTWKAMSAEAGGIRNVAQERIFQELTKMLTGPNPALAVEMLSSCGIMSIILPEIEALKGIEQPPQFHPEGDVYVHTVKALSLLKNPSPVTAWAALLHDTGKPATRSISDRIRFHNHDRAGADLSVRILDRLRAPRTLTDAVSRCVERHMSFISVTNMRLSTLKRFLASPTFDDELELHRVDCLASHGNIDNYVFLREKKAAFSDEEVKPAPLLTGKNLVEMGFSPGPLFGRILRAVYDLQLEEKLRSTEEAVQWVTKNRDKFNTV